MKKNKLYTVNKWNQPLFSFGENLFSTGGTWNQLAFNKDPLGYALATSQGFDPAEMYKKSKNIFGISKEDNPFSKGNLKNTFSKENMSNALKGVGTGLATAGAGMLGGMAANAISGGLTSKAGSIVGDVGSTVLGTAGTAIGGPVGGAVGSAVGQVLGGVTNALIGEKVDAAKLGRVEGDIAKLNSFTSNAGSFDDIQGPEAVSMDTDVYEGGLFNDVSGKNDELKRRLIAAKSFADRSVDNNIFNLTSNQLNDALANYAAFGGPINTSMDGAIGYGFMSDYLLSKNKTAENKTKMTNMFMGMPDSMFAFGGDMQTNSADFPTGLTHINAGGSHEENVNDGVQMGVDNEGTPNLVEEGETVYNDYVFSNRILADEATKQMFRLPKKKNITFAEISKKLEKEIAERPNDPISISGFKAQMQTLEEQQERQKSEMEAERAKAAFEALSPEEQTAVMQNAAQQESMAQQAAEEQAIAEQQAMQQPSPEEVAMMQQQQAMQADGTQAALGQGALMMAEGGNLYAGGSKLKPYAYSKTWDGFDYFDPAKSTYDEGYLNFVKGINQDWVDRILKGQYGSMGRYLAKNKGVALTPEQVAALATDKKYSDMHKAVASAYKEYLAGIDPKTGKPIEQAAAPERGMQVYIAGENGVTPVDESTLDDTYIIEDFDGVKIDRKKPVEEAKTEAAAKPEDKVELEIEPAKKADWMRYAGLFGPAVGLGMQMAGIGRPDYSDLNAAVSSAGNAHLATYKPLDNYLTYRPMDIWFEQNRMDANARATDRAIMNSASPSRMAGLIANSYNSQLASGDLYRKALEYNDAKRKDVAEFNRGTDQFNAEAFNRLSQFNASALNDAASRSTNARLHAAQQKLANDAGWYNSLYGNVSGLFKGISDLGRENRETNWRNALVTAGVFGAMDEDALVKAGIAKYKKGKKAKGGKIQKKRGLTY